MNIVERVARLNWKPPSREPPWKWAERYVTVDKTSPFPGKFRADTAPWTKELMEVFADNRIQDISVLCSAQSAKTQTIMILLAWAIAEDPGPIMWVMAAQDEAKTFARTRLMPTLESVDPIRRILPSRFEITNLEINFPNAPLIINGANSQSKLQSKPIRWLFLDEVRNYPPGAYDMVLKRTTAFWNARRVTISTPDLLDDVVDRAFKAGDQRHFYFPCSSCGQEQLLKFEQLKWEEDSTTRPGGEWDYDKLAATIRYECKNCAHAILDTFRERRFMACNGVWMPHNRKAPHHRVSFTWNGLLPPWIRWRTLVEEWLRAQDAWALGAEEPRKSFINERLGEGWDQHGAVEREMKPGTGYRMADLSIGEKWEKEFIRFLTVDKQKDCYWFVIRAWAKDASSRLISYGRLLTWEEVRDTQLKYKVSDRCTVIDIGYQQTECFEKCCDYGWTGFKGEDRDGWPWFFAEGLRQVRPYSQIQAGDPGLGTATQGLRTCPWFFWSNPTIKDQLFRLKTGKGVAWEIASDVSSDYLQQMCAEARLKVVSKTTGYAQWLWRQIGNRPNHLFDCEAMQIVCALMADLMPSVIGKADGANRTTSP